MRQALAGMLWSKQFYFFDLDRWLEEHHAHPLHDVGGSDLRNRSWFHMINDDVISMPDTWEYPWYASWDLAFHTVALSMVDIDFAKDQLQLMLRELYLHPNGQLPAYEWNFSDVNPPVHAWATLLVYETELEQRGAGDVAWLKSAFQKLLVNFTWWINRKDPTGRNVFEGGFLGLDNIGVFDRSASLPTGGRLEQSDGTAWMAFYAQSMLGIASELSRHDPIYEDMVLKFAEHFAFIAAAMDRVGDNQDELWDEEDGFFYDVLRLPDGSARRLKVRSMVGLLPLCATTLLPEGGDRVSDDLLARLRRRIDSMPELLATIHDVRVRGVNGRRAAGRGRRDQTATHPHPHARRERVPQPTRAARALSRAHADDPSASTSTATPTRFATSPPSPTAACSAATRTGVARCGSPSTTSDPGALLQLYAYYGDDFKVECPTGSGTVLHPVRGRPRARPPARVDLHPDEHGRRPVSTGDREVPDVTRTGRTCCCSTSTSTVTTAPASAPATRPGGPASWPVIGLPLASAITTSTPSFGGRHGLAWRPREALAERGVRLMVDFVPNHVAPINRVAERPPEYFVRGTPTTSRAIRRFLAWTTSVLARGRDPYFPPWPDVAQLDAFAPGLRGGRVDDARRHRRSGRRRALRHGDVAAERRLRARGAAALARCPQRVLDRGDRRASGGPPGLPLRRRGVLGPRVGPPAARASTTATTSASTTASSTRTPGRAGHLHADLDYQRPWCASSRTMTSHGPPASSPAAGAGSDRRHRHPAGSDPVARRPVRRPCAASRVPRPGRWTVLDESSTFHLELISASAALRRGDWGSCAAQQRMARGFRARSSWTWSWIDEDQRSLIVVNFTDRPAAACHPPWDDLTERVWRLHDDLAGDVFVPDRTQIARSRLFVQLAPWAFHVYRRLTTLDHRIGSTCCMSRCISRGSARRTCP